MSRIKTFFRHFIPHEKNNFRARPLHHDFLTGYLVLAIILVFCVRFSQTHNNVLGFATDITVQKLYHLTNKEREKLSLPDLSYNDKLAKAAQNKAQDMFTKDYWAHYAPDGKSPWNFIYDADYQYEYAGENLAKNFLTSDGVVDAWMRSPAHRENVVRPEYSEVGFAVANGVINGEETTLVVQMFGKPLDGTLVKGASIPKEAQKTFASVPVEKKITLPARVPFDIFKVFLSFLILVLFTDLYFALRHNLIRFHGKNIAHLVFLFFISLGFIMFISKGGII